MYLIRAITWYNYCSNLKHFLTIDGETPRLYSKLEKWLKTGVFCDAHFRPQVSPGSVYLSIPPSHHFHPSWKMDLDLPVPILHGMLGYTKQCGIDICTHIACYIRIWTHCGMIQCILIVWYGKKLRDGGYSWMFSCSMVW